MCDHDVLIEKYEDHRKVHQKFLRMFDNVIETFLCMQSIASDLDSGYNEILQLLKTQPKTIPSSPSPRKRRKAYSFDSPSVTVVQKDETPRNKSNPELAESILDRNIDLPDTEDSFFALTQSPSRREPLSPVKAPEVNAPKTPPNKERIKGELFPEQNESKSNEGCDRKKKKKSVLSLGRFSSSFEMSPETTKQAEMLPMRQKLATPKPKAKELEQENVMPPVGKWTAKKTTPGSVGRSDSFMRKTPTSSSKKDGCLLNRTRLRQTKLRFPDSLNKSMVDEDETYFDEFVVPSPTSTTALSGSRFLKSAKKKEQSTMVAPAKEENTKTTREADEDFDIDQTYFSEAEKDLTRSKKQFYRPPVVASWIKAEPLTQVKSSSVGSKPAPVLATDTQGSDSSSVLFVKPPSQDEIITIDETQPNRKDLFMDAIREEQRRDDNARLSVLNVMGPPPLSASSAKRDGVKQEKLLPMNAEYKTTRDKPTSGNVMRSVPNERRCTDCSKQYQYLLKCGHTADFACSKLPHNCRQCRLAKLHETPPGFWNPEFTPTQI